MCRRMLSLASVCIGTGLSYCLLKKSNIYCKENLISFIEYFDDPFEKSRDGRLRKYNGVWLPEAVYIANNGFQAVVNFETRDSDVYVASFPKSGTTWVQEIVYQVMAGKENYSYDKKIMEEKFPYLEYVWPGIKSLDKMPEKRFIKTHLPFFLLPKQLQNGRGKIIYIFRNPRDVCVSYFHFRRMFALTTYIGEFSDFFRSFLFGKVPYGPWSVNVNSYFNVQDAKNLLIISYEELHKHPEKCIENIANFLEIKLASSQIEYIVEHCKFDNMSQNPLVNYSWWDAIGFRRKNESKFMRKGKIGDWKNYMTPEMVREMDAMVAEEAAGVASYLFYD